jgi:hypothetical protein
MPGGLLGVPEHVDVVLSPAAEFVAGGTVAQGNVPSERRGRQLQQKTVALFSSIPLVIAYGFGKLAPFTDPITTFLNNHASYAAVAPVVGLIADYLVNKVDWLRERKATILAAGALAAGAALATAGIYETEAGYDAVGVHIDDHLVDPTDAVENKADPLDTLMLVTWVGAAMLFARRSRNQARQINS